MSISASGRTPVVFSCDVDSMTQRYLVDSKGSLVDNGWAFPARGGEDLVLITSALPM